MLVCKAVSPSSLCPSYSALPALSVLSKAAMGMSITPLKPALLRVRVINRKRLVESRQLSEGLGHSDGHTAKKQSLQKATYKTVICIFQESEDNLVHEGE